MLASSDIKEHLSRNYLSALAVNCGYAVEPITMDRDSIDCEIKAKFVGEEYRCPRPELKIQLKARKNNYTESDYFTLVLNRKNYEDLSVRSNFPRLIVYFDLPPFANKMLSWSRRRLSIKRCAYWTSIEGSPELPMGQESKTIYIPKKNVLSPAVLKKIMTNIALDRDFNDWSSPHFDRTPRPT